MDWFYHHISLNYTSLCPLCSRPKDIPSDWYPALLWILYSVASPESETNIDGAWVTRPQKHWGISRRAMHWSDFKSSAPPCKDSIIYRIGQSLIVQVVALLRLWSIVGDTASDPSCGTFPNSRRLMSHHSAQVPSLGRSWLSYAAVSEWVFLAFCKFPSFSSACFFVNSSILSSILDVAGLTWSKYRHSFLSDRIRRARVCLLSLSNRRRSSNFALRTLDFLPLFIK